MKILNRDDTEHGVDYVTLAEAEAEIQGWKDYSLDACAVTRRERDELIDAVRKCRDSKGRYHSQKTFERLLALLPENL